MIERDAAGFQLGIHSIGDRANREVLDLYQRIFDANDWRNFEISEEEWERLAAVRDRLPTLNRIVSFDEVGAEAGPAKVLNGRLLPRHEAASQTMPPDRVLLRTDDELRLITADELQTLWTISLEDATAQLISFDQGEIRAIGTFNACARNRQAHVRR